MDDTGQLRHASHKTWKNKFSLPFSATFSTFWRSLTRTSWSSGAVASKMFINRTVLTHSKPHNFFEIDEYMSSPEYYINPRAESIA